MGAARRPARGSGGGGGEWAPEQCLPIAQVAAGFSEARNPEAPAPSGSREQANRRSGSLTPRRLTTLSPDVTQTAAATWLLGTRYKGNDGFYRQKLAGEAAEMLSYPDSVHDARTFWRRSGRTAISVSNGSAGGRRHDPTSSALPSLRTPPRRFIPQNTCLWTGTGGAPGGPYAGGGPCPSGPMGCALPLWQVKQFTTGAVPRSFGTFDM